MRVEKRVVGFTGSRKGMTLPQKEALFAFCFEQTSRFHHGDCIGADAQADAMCYGMQIPVTIHPPTNPKARAYCEHRFLTEVRPVEHYLKRNRDIVDAADEIFAAVPGPEELYRRSGTWATVRYARKIGTPITVILPSGEESGK